jgi:hypothetical protein
MIRFGLFVLALTAGAGVALTCAQQAMAQPSAMKPMQDAQRKAEQKARDAQKKDEEQAASKDKPQKPDVARPASSP